MPILSPTYISTWYYMLDPNGLTRLFQSHKEKVINEVKPKLMLQGDIGTHVMSVGGIYHEINIVSPAIIVETSSSTQVTGVFDIIQESFNTLQSPTNVINATYLMESATIQISKEGVNCTVKFVSDQGGAFTPVFGPPIDFIARTAMWYDCIFFASQSNLPEQFQVISATINIKANINKEYFIGTDQSPYYCVSGYTIEGDLTILARPDQFAALSIPFQTPGELTTTGVSGTALSIGGISIAFGSLSLNTSVSGNLVAGEITTADINFHTYARYTTPIT